MECTVLQCLADQGRVVAITPGYRKIEVDGSGITMAEAVIQLRRSAEADFKKQSPPMPDGKRK